MNGSTVAESDRSGRSDSIQVISPRDVPLGGPRAMPVRRTLPQRSRSMIGAWCFIDHYGPDDVSETGGMVVPGHPHTGLQIISWVFQGTILHRDTLGNAVVTHPGKATIMTCGKAIAHSEHSTPDTAVLHGVQLWVALPDAHRFSQPDLEFFVPPLVRLPGASLKVFVGEIEGISSPVHTWSPLLGAEIVLDHQNPRPEFSAALNTSFEHGILIDQGPAIVNGIPAHQGQLVYLPLGTHSVSIVSTGETPIRVMVLGGAPLNENIVMWWNFVGRSHEEIVEFREAWNRQRSEKDNTDQPAIVPNADQTINPAGTPTKSPQPYGTFPKEWTETLPAPPMPNARLKPRT